MDGCKESISALIQLTLLFPLKRLVVLHTIRISLLWITAIILFVLETEDNPAHGKCDVITCISEYSVLIVLLVRAE